MKLNSASAGLAALAFANVSLAARPGGPPSVQVGPWQVEAIAPSHCRINRTFPDGTSLGLFYAGTGYVVFVDNRAWGPVAGRIFRMALISGGEKRPLVPTDPRRVGGLGLYMPVEESVAQAFATATAMEVTGPDGELLGRYDISEAAAAMARLPACVAEAAAHPWPAMAPPAPPPLPFPPPVPRSPARSHTPIYSIVTSADYPSQAAAAGEEGTVVFRLEIDRTGKVDSCTVIRSSGSASLDAQTCRLVSERARFQPARLRDGQAVADRVTSRIVWRLPPSEPSTPSP